MYETKPISNTFLENTKIVNEATNFFKSGKDFSDTNNINTLYNKNINYFSFNKNDINNQIPSNTINTDKNSFETGKLNKQKKFGWKNIMNINYNQITKDENILDNPLIKNILNSDINEQEIQNIPENYLVNLIHTLQGLANEAIKNKNDLELENKKLNQNLEEMKNNNEYLHQNNIKMNQKILNLNKQQKQTNNYIYNIFNQNNPYLNLNTTYKKKYYCHICTNKKFKSQFYLDSHIKRRHPDYSEKISIKKINKEKNKEKENKEFFQSKLNQLNKYFDYLVNKFIKKIQYIKINEKLNSLQNMCEMMQINNAQIANINQNNNYLIEKKIFKEKILEKKGDKKSENEESINTDKTEEMFQKKHDEEMKKLLKTKDLLEKKSGNITYHYWLLKKEYQFLTIKKNFAGNPEEEQIYHQRRRKRLQTLKVESKLMNTIEVKQDEDTKTLELNEQNNVKEKNNEENNNKNLLRQKKENIIDNNNNINDIKNLEEIKNNKSSKENKDIYDKTEKKEELMKSIKKKFNLKSEKALDLSDKEIEIEEEEDIDTQNLRKFFDNFQEREYKILSDSQFHKKTAIPEEFIKKNQDEIDNKLEEIIQKKAKKINFEGKDNKEMKAEMMRIYYETIDIKYAHGDRYLYECVNISNYINLKDIISDAYNLNFYAEDSFLETIKYNIKNDQDNSEAAISQNDQLINVSFGNPKTYQNQND